MDKQELIDALGIQDVITLELSNGDSCEIGIADNWVGGGDEGFMCDYLGNILYSSITSVVNALFAYLGEIGATITESDY